MPKRTNRQWAQDRRVLQARQIAVLYLYVVGCSLKEIAMAMRTTPDPIRRILAKAYRQAS